jgi:arginyl-tRNA synthetase
MSAAKSSPIERRLADRVADAIGRSGYALPGGAAVDVEVPRDPEHGDWATAVALTLAKAAKRPPREVAETLIRNLEVEPGVLDTVTLAGPGFINFRLSRAWLLGALRDALREPGEFGCSDAGRGERILVEFVSANPTGPLNVVSARAASYGDSLIRIMKAAGYAAEGEYYVNDWGLQAELFGASLRTRFAGLHGLEAPAIPEEGYVGAYVEDLARDLDVREARDWLALPEREQRLRFGAWGIERMVATQRGSLERFRVQMNRWYREGDLHRSGALDRVLGRLAEGGHVFDRDGARWFRSTPFGDQDDRVLVRSNGIPTYTLADAAYHEDKFGRGYGRLINVLGPDHHGHVVRMKALVQALGHDPSRLEVLLLQWVKLLRGGEVVKMSKRAGEFITLDDLVEEVGVDAARFFFLLRRAESPLDFDMELAVRRSEENPVYYVQYAHARIAHVLDYARQQGVPEPDPEAAPLELLSEPETDRVLRALAGFPSLVAIAAAHREPHRIPVYLKDLAARFHSFYHQHRVVTSDAPRTAARLLLTRATGIAVRRGLSLLGVNAPEAM